MKSLRKTTSAAALAALIVAGLAGSVFAQGPGESEGFVNAKEIKWGAAPPWLPNGAKAAVLHGDPGKSGPFVLRLKVPPGYQIPSHWHSQDESLTVIAGTLYFGSSDKIQTSKAHTLTAGAFHFLAGKDHHYLVAKTEAVVQVSGNGPFDIMYSNSNDDPTKVEK